MKYPVKFYPEILDDWCNEICHTHIDCPICKTEYAPTDAQDTNIDIEYHGYVIFQCLECGTKFRLEEMIAWEDTVECEMVK